MKRISIWIATLASVGTLLLSSCDDKVEPYIVRYGFEEAELGESGYINNRSYQVANLIFSNNYSETSGSWSGFAISNHTDDTTPGNENQYSVVAGGGANNSKNFAVGYQSEFEGVYPTFLMRDSMLFTPEAVSIALTTYTYLSTRDGDSYAKKFTNDDWLKLDIVGVHDNGRRDSLPTIDLIRWGDYKYCSWERVALNKLGRVKCVEFHLSSSDTGAFGMNTPAYIAIDNVEILYPGE